MKKRIVLGIGEILWDLLPRGKQVGGAPANFAYHAMALGAQSYIVSAVGDDPSGREIIEHVRRVGLDPEYIAVDPKYPTGTVTVQVDGKGIPSFIIHEGVAWDNIVLTERAGSQPWRFSSSLRPAANPQKVAVELPLTKPAAVPAGNPNRSRSHFSHVASNWEIMGDSTYNAAF